MPIAKNRLYVLKPKPIPDEYYRRKYKMCLSSSKGTFDIFGLINGALLDNEPMRISEVCARVSMKTKGYVAYPIHPQTSKLYRVIQRRMFELRKNYVVFLTTNGNPRFNDVLAAYRQTYRYKPNTEIKIGDYVFRREMVIDEMATSALSMLHLLICNGEMRPSTIARELGVSKHFMEDVIWCCGTLALVRKNRRTKCWYFAAEKEMAFKFLKEYHNRLLKKASLLLMRALILYRQLGIDGSPPLKDMPYSMQNFDPEFVEMFPEHNSESRFFIYMLARNNTPVLMSPYTIDQFVKQGILTQDELDTISFSYKLYEPKPIQ